VTTLTLVFDGGSKERNPGIGYGSFMIWVNDKRITHVPPTVYTGRDMNNIEAEYITLVRAMTWICQRFNETQVDLTIRGDCDLLRKQIGEMTHTLSGKVTFTNAWKSKQDYLIHYRDTIRSVLPAFRSFTYTYMNEKEVKQILGH
jgi:ribonuclease HI